MERNESSWLYEWGDFLSLGMAYTENPKPLKEPEGGKRCLDRWNQDKEWGKEKNIEKQRTTQDQEAYHIIYQTWWK